jgi:hypothetical protein
LGGQLNNLASLSIMVDADVEYQSNYEVRFRNIMILGSTMAFFSTLYTY